MEASQNAFAMLRSEEKVRRRAEKLAQPAARTEGAPQSKPDGGGLMGVAPSKMNWADVSEDEDDDYFYDVGERRPHTGGDGVRAQEVGLAPDSESSSAEGSEYESEEDEDHIVDAAAGGKSEQNEKKSPPGVAIKGMSDKERREKEVQELNAALAELGINAAASPPNQPKGSPASTTKKKRKPKKEAKVDDGVAERPTTADGSAVKPTVAPSPHSAKSAMTAEAGAETAVDRDEALKKLKAQAGKAKKGVAAVGPGVAALPSVRAEAKKKAEGKKQKTKKSEKLPPYRK